MTAAALPALDDLRGLGADVTIGDVPSVECPWCEMEDVRTSVRVTGEPAPHILTVIDGEVLVCRDCAPEVIRRAVCEQDTRSRRAIVVEVQATAELLGLSDAAGAAITRARRYYEHIVLNAPVEVADELVHHGLITRAWVMDAGGRTAWPLTAAGEQLREQMLDSPERRAAMRRSAELAASIVDDLSGRKR